MAHEKIIQRSALGRNGFLGDVYDAYRDTFCDLNIFNRTLPGNSICFTDMNDNNITYVFTDSLSDKLEKLNIEGELKLSLLCNFVNVSGSGAYINDSSQSEKCKRSSFIYQLKTQSQEFNLMDTNVLNCVDIEVLENVKGTHIVQKIEWGANATVTLESSSDSLKKIKEIGDQLKTGLKELQINEKGEYNKNTKNLNKNNKCQLKVTADVIPEGKRMETVEEALEFIAQIQNLVKKCNSGLGKPLIFHLISVNEIRRLLNLADVQKTVLFQGIGDNEVIKHMAFFERISTLKKKTFDRVNFIQAKKKYVIKACYEDSFWLQIGIIRFERKLKEELSKSLLDYRKGKINFVHLDGLEEINTYEIKFCELQKAVDKIDKAQEVLKLGAVYLGRDESLHNALLGIEEAVIIFISEKFEKNCEDFVQQFSFFVDIAKKETEWKMIVADLDLIEHENIDCITVWKIESGIRVSTDYYNELHDANALNMVICDKIQSNVPKPSKGSPLEVFCPLSVMGGSCEYAEVRWHCLKCKEIVEFGFDSHFYCQCGKGFFGDYHFKCNNKKHGDFAQFDKAILEICLSHMKVMKTINILVLGPSGVGKSTWLNSIINYLEFESLDEAEAKGVRIAIPVCFAVTDDNMQTKMIKIGESGDDEILKTGQSATQFPKTYSFEWKDSMVRIIDTPGIGDVRGVDRDQANLRNVLDHISHIDELHGICILLKPNDSRLSFLFKFCVSELLTNLHKSASTNIIFCFTHSRETFYKPGETLPVLKELLQPLPVEVVLSKDTIYCLDNEAFRFLCTLNTPDITYDEFERSSFVTSWKKSVVETNRMFEHIQQLKPHKTTETITLNEARRLILTLTKPMADITRNIQVNIAAISDKKKLITDTEASEKDLEKMLFIPQIVLVPKQLGYPRTVCTSQSCVEYRMLKGADSSQIRYKTHCHEQCYLKNVLANSHPNVQLKSCQAMNSSYNCTKCGCSWAQHMHITYSQEEKVEQVTNDNVQDEIKAKQSLRANIAAKVIEIENRIRLYESESVTIREVSVTFGRFLAKYAIAPYNDAMQEYIEHQIEQERHKIDPTELDRKVLEGLRDNLRRYNEAKNIIEDLMSLGLSSGHECDIQDVKPLVEKLYSLPLSGKQLKELVEVANASNARSMRHNVQSVPRYNRKKKIKSPLSVDYWFKFFKH